MTTAGAVSGNEFTMVPASAGIWDEIRAVSAAYGPDRQKILIAWHVYDADAAVTDETYAVVRSAGSTVSSPAGELITSGQAPDVVYHPHLKQFAVGSLYEAANQLYLTPYSSTDTKGDFIIVYNDAYFRGSFAAGNHGWVVAFGNASNLDEVLHAHQLQGGAFSSPPTAMPATILQSFAYDAITACDHMLTVAAIGSPSTTLTHAFSGSACNPAISVLQQTVDFGEVAAPAAPKAVEVRGLYSTGTVESVTLQPEGLFKIASNECDGVSLAHWETCEIWVEPVEGIAGQATVTMTITPADGDAKTVTLQGYFSKAVTTSATLKNVSPADRATGIDPASAVLVWQAAVGAASYKVSVCKGDSDKDCVTSTATFTGK